MELRLLKLSWVLELNSERPCFFIEIWNTGGVVWQLMGRTSEDARCSRNLGLLICPRRSVDRIPVLWLWWRWKVLPILSWVCGDLFHLGFCGGPCLRCWKILSGCCDRDIFACFGDIELIVRVHYISSHRVSPVLVVGFRRLLLSRTSLVEVTSTWCLSAVLLQNHIPRRKVFDLWPC